MTSHDLTQMLDEVFDHRELAARAGYSVAQVYRNLQRPMLARRRLLLERAAYHLVRGTRPVGEIALDSGFDSPDGFARAFRRHYGVPPTVFRDLQASEYRCGPRGGIHYNPGPWETHRQGDAMNLIHHILENHRTQTHEILEVLKQHPEVHDTVLPLTNPFPWECERPDDTVLQLAERCATMAGPWLHAIEGYSTEPWDGRIDSLPARMDDIHARFTILVNNIEQDGTWETTFVDADCDPPQVFSYRSVVHFVISFNEHARITLGQRLKALGVTDREDLPPQR